MSTSTVMLAFGTRPEAIKMLPVMRALQRQPGVQARVVVTAQHRELLDRVLKPMGVDVDQDLDLMRGEDDLASLFGRLVTGMGAALAHQRPDMLVVHGDTSTTFAASLAGFYAHVPVAHVEAGLRTGSMQAPWPEEANRRLTTLLTTLHFAPTEAARTHLLREGVDDDVIHVTGNTVVDAIKMAAVAARSDPRIPASFGFLVPGKRLVLVTGHRRENFGTGLAQLCAALKRLAARDDLQIAYVLHPNPDVDGPVRALLDGSPSIHLLPPLDYLPFVWLMDRAHVIVTDSGGIQEEAPSLGTPVLVTRALTERPEAITAGTALLVGTDTARIVAETCRLLDEPQAHTRMVMSGNPFGDGGASERIAITIAEWLSSRAAR